MSKGKLKIHSENILPIIKKWLYSDKDIFVRELVSNSCDALSKLKTLAQDVDESTFRVELKIDKENKLLTIEDNGIGMTGSEVKEYIAQLAFSGAEEFLKKYKDGEKKDQIIGHFGLGFYSSFMVSSLVEIETLSYQEGAEAAKWSCDGSIDYTLKKGSRSSRGTKVILHVEEEEYLDAANIRKILDRYCSFLPYPIFLEEEQINKTGPLWIEKPGSYTDEEAISFYKKLYPQEMEDPIFWIHLNVDHPFHLQGILYFPKATPRFDFNTSHIKLFCNRVYVTDECKDLFPEFLTVLRGAIDSHDIPLNVSRSYLQMDRTVRQLSSYISKKIADRLQDLYTNDREKFEKCWPDMETILKLGALRDEKFYERIKSFLLWKNTNDTWTTIETYTETHKEEYDNKVFYTAEESKNSDFLEVYKEKDIEVIYGGGPLDSALFAQIEKKLGIHFQRIDGGMPEVLLDKENEKTVLDADGKSEGAKMAEAIKTLLGKDNISVEAKSLGSKEIPGFVMIEEQTRRMREYFAMTQKEMPLDAFGNYTFVINTNNPLIQSTLDLEKEDKALAKAMVNHLYELSLLSQKEMHPDNLDPFIKRSRLLLAAMTAKSQGKPYELPIEEEPKKESELQEATEDKP